MQQTGEVVATDAAVMRVVQTVWGSRMEEVVILTLNRELFSNNIRGFLGLYQSLWQSHSTYKDENDMHDYVAMIK